jgi:hypothetical protein
MTRGLLLTLVCGALVCGAPPAAAGQTPSAELQKLDVSVGHWVFHGTSAATAKRPARPFTWDEQCGWSPNHLYLECTFSNDWGGGHKVESLVVETYNTTDHGYWHYEFFSTGESGKDPFVSRMDVAGNVWTEYGREAIPGKQTGERIIYTWTPPDRVTVTIETSKNGTHWIVVDRAEGVKSSES